MDKKPDIQRSSDGIETADTALDLSNVAVLHPVSPQHQRMVEALLFAASEPLDEASLTAHLPAGIDVAPILAELVREYAHRGVHLQRIAGKWAFRTAPDLAFLLRRESEREKRLSRAAIETLAIIAYHQPVTRAEIEDIRGVSVSKGTLELLLETEWIHPRGRRRSPGRPLTFGTTPAFENHFGLASIKDLPGLDELRAAGLLDARLPPDFRVDIPDPDSVRDDEDPLDPEDLLDSLDEAEISNVIAGPGLREPLDDLGDEPEQDSEG